MPTVSCIVMTHNDGSSVAEAVASVLAQSHPVDEIVIADDASTDGSQEVLEQLMARHAQVRLILRPVNLGAAANRDDAIRRSQGDLVTYLDGDDVFLPDKVRCEVAALGDDPSGIAFSNVRTTDAAGRVLEENDLAHLEGRCPEARFRAAAGRRRGWLARNILIPRAVYEAAGISASRARMYDDYDLLLHIAAVTERWYHSGITGYEYRRRARSNSARPVFRRLLEAGRYVAGNRALITAKDGLLGVPRAAAGNIARFAGDGIRKGLGAN